MQQLKRDWEVIVVGAGPAGSTAARVLAESGHEVALIDQSRFPRHKLCAGAISAKATALLPRQAEDLIRERLHSLTLLSGGRRITCNMSDPYAFTVNRCEFDQMLVDLAVKAGCELITERHVDAVEQDRTGVAVTIDGKQVRADVVIRAEGASGFARLFGRPVGFALESVESRDKVLDGLELGNVLVKLGTVRGGYSWIIPQGTLVSIGIATMLKTSRALRSSMNRWLQGTIGSSEGIRVAGHALATAVQVRSCALSRVLLAGDAAGLGDPVSGEGIYYALWSGMAAGRAVHLYVAGRESTAVYDRWLKQDIWPELIAARKLYRLIYSAPAIASWIAGWRPHVMKMLLGAVSGKNSYRDVMRFIV